MRRKSLRGAWLLVAWLALAPAVAWGQSQEVQGYAPSSFTSPLPIGSTRPEDGGFFAFAQAAYFIRTNPLKSQVVGVYGFRDTDGSVTGTVNQFVGGGQTALNVNQITGQDTYVVGTEMGVGWKFGNGSSLALNWMYLGETHYTAAATIAPKVGILDQNLANSYLYAGVYNFPSQYSGPDFKIRFGTPQARFLPNGVQTIGSFIVNPNFGQPNAQAAYGIWNGAQIMTIDFIQRFQQYEVIYREPIFETETYRLNGLVGPRYSWIWERFGWRTTASDGIDPLTRNFIEPGPQNVALYTNIVSNRMYGAVAGCEQEWYLGHGFVVQLKLEGALFADTSKVIAKYETADRFAGLPESKRGARLWSIVPEADATLGMMWYPAEFVQLYAGYQVMGFLNTIAARAPIDLNYGNLSPHYSHTAREFSGFKAGLAFTF